MTPKQAESFRYNVLDLTKVWPHKDYPLRPIGKFVLNKNVENYFAEVEQVGLLLPLGNPDLTKSNSDRLLSFSPCPLHRGFCRPCLAVPPLLLPRHPPSPTRRQLLSSPCQQTHCSGRQLPARWLHGHGQPRSSPQLPEQLRTIGVPESQGFHPRCPSRQRT